MEKQRQQRPDINPEIADICLLGMSKDFWEIYEQ